MWRASYLFYSFLRLYYNFSKLNFLSMTISRNGLLKLSCMKQLHDRHQNQGTVGRYYPTFFHRRGKCEPEYMPMLTMWYVIWTTIHYIYTTSLRICKLNQIHTLENLIECLSYNHPEIKVARISTTDHA